MQTTGIMLNLDICIFHKKVQSETLTYQGP